MLEKRCVIKPNERDNILNEKTYQVTAENNPRSVTHQVLDGGNSRADPSVISDVGVIIQRNAEINTHEHALSLQISFLQCSYASLRRHSI